jgi:lipoprotein-anchoring transpeptidase ErfK/SrfK
MKPSCARAASISWLLAVPLLASAGPEPPEPPSAAPGADGPGVQSMRIEVNIGARELYEYHDGERVSSYPVAVGQPEYPTPTGEWGIHRVDWNPDWTPPDSDWAEGRDYTPPGHPDNPMGRVRMVYRAPYSIHGTEVLESLGQAASHGSIRMANDDIMELARRVMHAGGAPRSEEWFQEVIAGPFASRPGTVRPPRHAPGLLSARVATL